MMMTATALEDKKKPRTTRHRVAKPEHKKLIKLPSNAKVHKRPLLHPAIASPYAGASQKKVVYVSARTPFLSTVKRVEKLLRLSDKRLVQSATTAANHGVNKRKRGRDEQDEVLNIAREVERLKGKKRRIGPVEEDGMDGVGEDVVIRGTGKAIQKALELGLWFQQRDEYTVRLRTGSVGAIDDIEVEEDEYVAAHDSHGDSAENPGEDAVMGAAEPSENDEVHNSETVLHEGISVKHDDNGRAGVGVGQNGAVASNAKVMDEIPETRIRYVSMLEVAVSLR